MSKLTIEAVLETFADYAEEEHGEDRAEALARAQEALRTAKAEPVTMDRDALAKDLFTVREQIGDWETGSQAMRDYWLDYADAVIAHLAAQPVTGTVEREEVSDEQV